MVGDSEVGHKLLLGCGLRRAQLAAAFVGRIPAPGGALGLPISSVRAGTSEPFQVRPGSAPPFSVVDCCVRDCRINVPRSQ